MGHVRAAGDSGGYGFAVVVGAGGDDSDWYRELVVCVSHGLVWVGRTAKPKERCRAKARRYKMHVNCLTSKEVSYIKSGKPEPNLSDSRSLELRSAPLKIRGKAKARGTPLGMTARSSGQAIAWICAQRQIFAARGGDVWYTAFALNTAVVLCGSSG